VLVVDDSTSIQAVLKQVLGKDRGFEVVGTAANGIEAAKLLRTLEVDAMTLDIHMPGQGGVDYLKANFSRAHPPVVMVSSVDREEADLAHKCLTIGASDYVEKPTLANMGERGEELRNKIRAALRHRQHRGLRPPLQLFVEDGVVIAAFDETMQQGACIALKASELTSARLDQCLADIVRAVGHRPAGALQWKAVGIGQSLATASSHFDSRKIPVNSVPWSRGPLEALYDPSSGRLRVAKAQVAAEGGPSSRAKESRRTRVLIVDDSTTIQKLLAKILGSDPSIEVVGVSGRPVEVAGLVEELAPDVITLDIHMPEMDGVALLKKLMARRPVRAVMISSLGLEDGPLVLAALEAGAVDYIQKPSAHRLDAEAPVIVERVKVAGRARLIPAKCSLRSMATETIDKTKLVAIGSSTGGTEALRSVLTAMPAEIPPILIVQHIPAGFSKAFAERLDSLCSFKVKEAVDGDPVVPNRALIAPGGKHMRVVRRGDLFSVVIEETEPVNRHRPSVDVLFDSVAAQVGAHSVGIILTGMGTDGAQGLLRMRDAGAVTLGQDEASCIVYGMPREAAKIGGVQHVVPLDQVAETVVRLLRVKAVSRVS
jgi:two-component system chemotaxis response regulator CheB